MKHLAALLLILICRTALCQELLDQYYDFNGAITTGNEKTALALGEKILPSASSLSGRRQAIFYYKLAGLYENKQNTELAIDLYERSLKLEPDFYVPHLALGYLFLSRVNILARQMNAEKNNADLHEKYKNEYHSQLRKALTHLEKAMACDPNDEALILIKNGYQTLKDQPSLNSLDLRLKGLQKDCISVLSEN